jgi:hypothetical protein
VFEILSVDVICTLASAFLLFCLYGFHVALRGRTSASNSLGQAGIVNKQSAAMVYALEDTWSRRSDNQTKSSPRKCA